MRADGMRDSKKNSSRRGILRAAMLLAGPLTLAGCMGSTLGNFPGSQIQPTGQPQVSGETIGTGSVRVALLLPMTGQGSAASVATAFRNSAALALQNFPNADVQLLVKDTAGTSQGGRAAAQAAISEGAELILGPVFASAVSGAATAARASGVPVIAFSTDTSVASRGVYLLSFLPESDVRRIIGFAASQQKRSYAALVPDNAYGAVTEAAFRQEVGRSSGRIVTIQRYKMTGNDTSDLVAKANALAASLNNVDALFVPQGNVAPVAMQSLISKGASLGTVKVLGTSQWDNPQIGGSPVLAGSWYPGPENQGFQAFSSRYQSAYGAAPPRNASVVYDGVTLAAGLIRSAGPERFSQRVITNRDGFIGIDGLFRFTSNGLNQRGLAVYQNSGSGMQVIAPAPRDFRSIR